MEFILASVILYLVAMLLVESYTIKKLGARSGLFGAGLVTMFAGFSWHWFMMDPDLFETIWDGYDEKQVYCFLRFATLIVGLVGIAMMAVHLLKAVKELRDELTAVREKLHTPTEPKADYEKLPTWKKIGAKEENIGDL